MGGECIEQGVIIHCRIVQLQFVVKRFFLPQEIAYRQAAAGDECRPSVARRRGFQVVNDVWLDAAFAQEGEGVARGGAARVVLEGDVHGNLR